MPDIFMSSGPRRVIKLWVGELPSLVNAEWYDFS